MNKRRLIALASAAVLALTPLATAGNAAADGTSAVVVNQNDYSDVYRLMLQIRRAVGDTVDTSNLAAAVASCNSCQTVAVALQGVLVMSDPSVFVPENMALALNVDCNLCQTIAIADQTLVQTGGPAHFTAAGSRAIAQIRQELEALRNSGLTIEEIAAKVEELNARLQQVLATEVVPAGPPSRTTGAAPAGDQGSGTTTGTTPTSTDTTPTSTDTTPTSTDTTPTSTDTTPTSTGTTPTSTTPTDTTTTSSGVPSGSNSP
jgi:putative peptide zinc metalloprotease protein